MSLAMGPLVSTVITGASHRNIEEPANLLPQAPAALVTMPCLAEKDPQQNRRDGMKKFT
jgi:hypothetical protein